MTEPIILLSTCPYCLKKTEIRLTEDELAEIAAAWYEQLGLHVAWTGDTAMKYDRAQIILRSVEGSPSREVLDECLKMFTERRQAKKARDSA